MTYMFSDHLGSTVVTKYQLGNVYRNGYYPFGEDRYTSSYTPYQFTDQRKEVVIGLYDYHARFYDPYLNHFVQPDTIIPDPSNPQSWNRYSYVNNNPINYNDPSGHVVCQGELSCESSSIYNDDQISALYQEIAGRYQNQGRSGYQHEYYSTVAAYHMALAQYDYYGADANLNHIISAQERMQINGFFGVKNALDTAFQNGGSEIAESAMVSGVGLYGALRTLGKPRFIVGVKLYDHKGIFIQEGTVDIGATLQRIDHGIKNPHYNDGAIHRNNEGFLPDRPVGYYREFVVETPGYNKVGPQRIVVGQNGEVYYFSDHFISPPIQILP